MKTALPPVDQHREQSASLECVCESQSTTLNDVPSRVGFLVKILCPMTKCNSARFWALPVRLCFSMILVVNDTFSCFSAPLVPQYAPQCLPVFQSSTVDVCGGCLPHVKGKERNVRKCFFDVPTPDKMSWDHHVCSSKRLQANGKSRAKQEDECKIRSGNIESTCVANTASSSATCYLHLHRSSSIPLSCFSVCCQEYLHWLPGAAPVLDCRGPRNMLLGSGSPSSQPPVWREYAVGFFLWQQKYSVKLSINRGFGTSNQQEVTVGRIRASQQANFAGGAFPSPSKRSSSTLPSSGLRLPFG
jgi:hypothetical protein|mmetsp:Transcript_32611/g.53085  ORF Transcript_32611/g.53085 Transcript_32611/m.53085 type:complete len:302 (+) Transcript_32611:650-1555(+)